MTVHVDSFQAIAYDTDAVTLIEGPDNGHYAITSITLYNPNGSAATFIIRKVVEGDPQEIQVRRVDDSIPATDIWEKSLGRPWIVGPLQRYELVLDATPTLGIEWCLDFGRLA